jgi:hypothetical protein
MRSLHRAAYRARWTTGLVVGMTLFTGIAVVGDAGVARAQATSAQPIPRTLQGGAPTRHLFGIPSKKAPAAASPRSAPTPAIRLDARERGAHADDARRGAELLQREIALLQRLVARTPKTDMRRADALLRLSQAYQELIWAQKLELQTQLEQGDRDCRCSAEPAATGEACALASVAIEQLRADSQPGE